MANDQCTTATVDFIGNGRREKIVIEDHFGGISYIGTVDQLLAVGLITPDMIPPGKKRFVRKKKVRGELLRDYWIVHKRRGQRLELYKWKDAAERNVPVKPNRPKEFTPDGFNRFLFETVAPILDAVWHLSRGMEESRRYGKSTIRVSARGMGKIGAAIDSILDVIKTDPLEVGDACRPPLTVVRTDPTES